MKRPVSQSSETGFIKLDQTEKKGVPVMNGSDNNLTFISNFTSDCKKLNRFLK